MAAFWLLDLNRIDVTSIPRPRFERELSDPESYSGGGLVGGAWWLVWRNLKKTGGNLGFFISGGGARLVAVALRGCSGGCSGRFWGRSEIFLKVFPAAFAVRSAAFGFSSAAFGGVVFFGDLAGNQNRLRAGFSGLLWLSFDVVFGGSRWFAVAFLLGSGGGDYGNG